MVRLGALNTPLLYIIYNSAPLDTWYDLSQKWDKNVKSCNLFTTFFLTKSSGEAQTTRV